MPIFAPDSVHLYTLTDWGGPVRLTAFSLASFHLEQTGSEVDGQNGRHFPSCAGPAMAMKVIEAGATLVAFCHFDGEVWFFNLHTLTSTLTLQSGQQNPFWLSPIFTPDGRLLYLHQWYGFGDRMQVVDLVRRRILGPVAMPTSPQQKGPFAGLAGDAYAGGIATTVPISPDGLKLYSATDQGIMVLRIPDLKPLLTLAAGTRSSEVWVSGDGKTLYLTADDSSRLLIMREDGSALRSISLPSGAGGFIAAEHG
jgi:hypothetical protein